MFINPINVFCDNIVPDIEDAKDLYSGNIGDYETGTSNFDSGIYIIIITTVIVVGVLFFAMWKTIRSRKQF